MRRKNPIRQIIQSFGHAVRGICWVLQSEPNFRIHFAATVFVIGLGLFFPLSAGEWIALALVSAMVLMTEVMNTAIEYLADALHPGRHPEIGKAKDAAAGAVMIAALAAVVVGLVIFLPKLWNLYLSTTTPHG